MPEWVDIDAYDPGQLFTTDDAELLRTNQDFLRNPPNVLYTRGFGDADYTVTSAVFENIDGSNMDESLTTYGGDVRVRFSGRCLHSTTGWIYFEIVVDGTPLSNDTTTGLGGIRPDYGEDFTLHKRIPLAAGAHTFAIQWRTNTGTGTLDKDSYIQFDVVEKV